MQPDERRERNRLLALLTIGYTGFYLCRSNFSVAMPLLVNYLEEGGLGLDGARLALGSIASVGVLAYAIGKFASGPLNDRFGGRVGFLGGMAGSVVFTLLFALGGGLPIFTLAWIGNRLVQSGGWVGLVQISSRWLPAAGYATAMAILSQSYLVGDALVRVALGTLISLGAGWRSVFFGSALALALLALWIGRSLRATPTDLDLPEPPAHPANVFAGDENRDLPATTVLQGLFRDPSFRIVCVLSFGLTLLRETFNTWTPLYFVEGAGMTAGAAASWSAVFPFFGGLGVLIAGIVGDRTGRLGRARAIVLGCAGAMLALIGLARLGEQPSAVAAIALVSLVAVVTLGAYAYLAGATALDLGGKKGSGTASGVIDGFGYLGGILAGRGIADIAVGSGWSGAFVALAAVALLCAVAALVLTRYEKLVTERASKPA